MKARINGMDFDFTVCPKIEYVRATGDYEMEFAEPHDWEVDIYSVTTVEGTVDIHLTAEDERAYRPLLIAHWRENYDPTPNE